MTRPISRAIAWLLIVLLGIAVIIDAAMLLGFTRCVQYAYNAFFFIVALPGLLIIALKDHCHARRN